MFGKSNNNTEVEIATFNKIGNGTTITGDINSNGDFRIDGVLKGNISISGKLVVGPSGIIEGNIVSQNADILGEIHGKVNVTELLALKASAKLLGDIVTGKISIEPNATFTGTCNMGAVVKNIVNAKEKRDSTTQTA
jgi:cytoskeletal protein CcmA (bactofilin family)